MNNKSSLLKKLEKQDVIIHSTQKCLKKMSKQINWFTNKILFFLLFTSFLALFCVFFEQTKDMANIFLYFSFFGLIFIACVHFGFLEPRKNKVIEKKNRVEKEYILNKIENVDLLFEELMNNGIENVKERTAKNISTKKKELLCNKKHENLEDLFEDTKSLSLGSKYKDINLINY
jgi:hypothetical protein